MKRLMTLALTPVRFAVTGVSAAETGEEMTSGQVLTRHESQTSFKGPGQFFTGNVKVDMLFSPTAELSASGAYVSFAPGARSAWHTIRPDRR